MRRTRFMSLFFLALAVPFFCLQDVRWALQLQFPGWFTPERRIATLKQEGIAKRDPAALAYVALNNSSAAPAQVVADADRAVVLDNSLAWIYYFAVARSRPSWGDARVRALMIDRIERLEANDPQNAAPRLLHAELIRAGATSEKDSPVIQTEKSWSNANPASPVFAPWAAMMQDAFDAPRYDAYGARRFMLERDVLTSRGWASPATMVASVVSYRTADSRNVREYANIAVQNLGQDALNAGRIEDARRIFARVVQAGVRMQSGASFESEQSSGRALELIGSQGLVALLKKLGRADELELVRIRMDEVRHGWGDDTREPFEATSVPYWRGLLLWIFSYTTLALALVTTLVLIYVNVARWRRSSTASLLYRAVSVAENYLPAVLFLSGLALFVSYAPYAGNMRAFMRSTQPVQMVEPFLRNVYPAAQFLPVNTFMPVARPFVSYLLWALVMGLLAVGYGVWEERKARRAAATKTQSATG